MIKLTEKIKNMYHVERDINPNKSYLIRAKPHYQIYDTSQNLIFETKELNVNNFLIIDHLLYINTQERNSTYCFDLKTKQQVWFLDYCVYFAKKYTTSNKRYCICSDNYKENIRKFDFKNKESPKVICERILSTNHYIINDHYIETFEKNIVKYDLNRENLLWEIDLGTIGDYYDKIFKKNVIGRIATWAINDKSLIVVIGQSVIAIDFETGKIKWHQAESKNFMFIEVIGDKALLSGDIAFQWINLETGFFESKMVKIERFSDGEYDGILPSGYQLKYKDGSIWHSVFNRSKRFLGKYDPATGKLIEKFDFPDGENLSSPEFQGNKIFVNTSEGDLYIFERETDT